MIFQVIVKADGGADGWAGGAADTLIISSPCHQRARDGTKNRSQIKLAHARTTRAKLGGDRGSIHDPRPPCLL